MAEVAVTLHHSFVAIAETVQVALQGLSEQVQVLDALLAHARAIVEVGAFYGLIVLLANEPLLEL